MIDGIKILNLGVDRKLILANDYLNFAGHHLVKTGEELNYPIRSKYQSLDFSIRPEGVVGLNGSLHKYFNKGEHNHNDYSFQNIQETISDLVNRFSIDIKSTKLNNVEIGLNIILDSSPQKFIKSVINYKGEPFYPMSKAIVKKGMGIECKYDQYYIKIYDKGAQYELDEHILRIEIKVVRMQYFKQIGLQYLVDLNNRNIYPKLKDLFSKMLNNLLVCDAIKLETLKISNNQDLILSKGVNPKYWVNLKPSKEFKKESPKEAEKQRKDCYKKLEKFKGLVSQYGLASMLNDIKTLSSQKWDLLIGYVPIECNDIPDKLTENNETNSGQINTIYKKVIITPSKNPMVFCTTTGADISDQKKGSKFISAKKVGYLEAHRIRNADSYPRRNLRVRINKYDNHLTLFDMKAKEIIRLTDTQKKSLDFWKGTPYEVKLPSKTA